MSKGKLRRVYNGLFAAAFLLAAPYYFFRMWRRGQWREGFAQRFGKFGGHVKQALTNRHVIWIHAVSVGEVNICTQLIRAIEPKAPNLKIVVSTTTSTGMELLRRKLPSHIEKIYYPIDRPRYVSRALNVIHPEAVVLVEAEIWPNFLWRLAESRIPVFLVNARLSEKSTRSYRQFAFLFRPLFAGFTGVGAQNEADATRLIDLGCEPKAVRVLGNLKFDAAKLEERRQLDVSAMLKQLGMPQDALILLGGSTHAGEEALLAEVFLRLRREFPKLRLILVPRHFERGKEVGRVLTQSGIRFAYRNEVTPNTTFAPGAIDCLLVNTTGELKFFYAQASVIFVGKSLTAKGGQSPIEPGALGKAMVFGPNMQNFQAIAAEFIRQGAALQIRDAAELETGIRGLLADAALRESMGREATEVVSQNLGAIARTVEMILPHLHAEEVYVAK